jgi:predicted ATPase
MNQLSRQEADQTHVFKIVLSGGPCAGKSTCLARLRETLTDQGWEVYCCPEIPTILLTAGAKYFGVSQEQLLHTETAILNVQFAFEHNLMRIAQNCGRKAIIIFDRGGMDVKAYLSDS